MNLKDYCEKYCKSKTCKDGRNRNCQDLWKFLENKNKFSIELSEEFDAKKQQKCPIIRIISERPNT